jgi:carbohydrate diacid regulator
MVQKLHQILQELTEISGVGFGLYQSPGEYVDGTFSGELPHREVLERLFACTEKLACEDGFLGCLLNVDEPLLLVAEGSREAAVCVRMAASQLSLYFNSIKKSTDKNAFAAALLEGEIPRTELYKQAGRLKLKDMPRVFFLFELAQPLGDLALQILSGLFANGKQDLIFLQDETHLALIKAYDTGDVSECARQHALMAIDTILSELMIRTRVGYSTPKHTLLELFDAKQEAALALRVSGIFRENQEVASYARLGIARLIYELPKDLCELFLHEVFGERLPDQELDEEMKVTIRLFFENNLNISETARQLYLHRNTLVYRLERFEKLMGLDIRKFDDAMTFRIAMMVLAHYRSSNSSGEEVEENKR